MLNEIIAIYAITDDLLKAMPAAGYAEGHNEDCRRVMNDAEIIAFGYLRGDRIVFKWEPEENLKSNYSAVYHCAVLSNVPLTA